MSYNLNKYEQYWTIFHHPMGLCCAFDFLQAFPIPHTTDINCISDAEASAK